MKYNELYNEYHASGMSLSSFAKARGLDKGNLSRAFRKLQRHTTGVVVDNYNVVKDSTTSVVALDSGNSDKMKEAVTASEALLNSNQDCRTCEQVVNLESQIRILLNNQAEHELIQSRLRYEIQGLEEVNHDIEGRYAQYRKENGISDKGFFIAVTVVGVVTAAISITSVVMVVSKYVF
jgi:hypothetical protein